MYQALYRKWRPKTFADVVGQAHITDTLRRQAAQGRLSHAYLFTGTRGTGKTTCAKILAKAVNCLSPVDGDPCGQCAACKGIDNGSLLDVLELDAASNNGVDQVRALRDEAIYSPSSVRYRVYIVDEVHMLTPAAFNALLKILEEPPAHLIFILATTELHKVPATILSRCQRFAFKRIQPQDIAKRLGYVAGQEGMDLTADAAELLARLSDGALRDALSLLDQCGGAGGTIDSDRVLDVLGLAGKVQTAGLMGSLLRRDVREALLTLDRLYGGGKDMGALLGELSTLARDLLIRMTVPEAGAALLSGGYDNSVMDGLSQGVSPNRLLYMTSQLQTASAALPLSTNRRTDVELCLMRLCDESLCGDVTALAARLARLEEGGVPAVPAASAQPIAPVAAPAAPARSAPAKAAPRAEKPMPEKPAPKKKRRPLTLCLLTMALRPGTTRTSRRRPGRMLPLPPGTMRTRRLPMESPQPSRPRRWNLIRPTNRLRRPRRKVGVPVEPPPKPASVDGDLWGELVEKYKDRLTPMYWFFLNAARGVLEGGMMVVHCEDDMVLESLNCEEVTQAIKDVTGEKLGRTIAVRYVVGGMDAVPKTDKLDDLIRAGSKYPEFKVKE